MLEKIRHFLFPSKAAPFSRETDFFLPNFCDLKTLFVLAIGAELMALIFILATGDVLLESWDELGLLSIFVQWIAFLSAAVLCLSRRILARFSLIFAAITAYLFIIGITAFVAFAAQMFLMRIDYQWGNNPDTMGQFVTRCVAISAIVAFLALRYFYVQQQWKQRIELESQARVEALQARIRPHFLFNSMNIIASLIRSQPLLAEQAVEDLSDLFRATLKETGSIIPLAQEWELCRNYLRIEGLRLGERLTIKEDFSQVPTDAAIPMLTLQPLMENAIYHGIQLLEKGGTIFIRGELQGNKICIRVANPVPTISEKRASGNKMALVNIRHRLDLLFGSQAKLGLDVNSERFEVSLVFPYLRKA